MKSFPLAALLAFGMTMTAHAASEDALYKRADVNANGTLSSGEFRAFIQALAKNGNPIAKRVRFWRVYGLAFRLTDSNKDGELTPNELRRSAKENADKVK